MKKHAIKKLINKWLKFLGVKTIAIPRQRRSRRICAKCETAIRKHHKWQFNEQGRAEHHHCDNPTVKISGVPIETAQQELIEVQEP